MLDHWREDFITPDECMVLVIFILDIEFLQNGKRPVFLWIKDEVPALLVVVIQAEIRRGRTGNFYLEVIIRR